MKAVIVYDVAGSVTNLTIDADRITSQELPDRGYLVMGHDHDGHLTRAIHVSRGYLIDVQEGP